MQNREAPRINRVDDKHAKFIDILAKIAFNSDFGSNARLAAAIVYKNDIISIGTNKFKTHPFQAKFGRNSHSIYLHAETTAIKNALRIISQRELSASTLYISRIKYLDETKKNMIFGLAKPCSGCMRAIVTFNIKKVIYSLDETGYAYV